MHIVSQSSKILLPLALLAGVAPASLAAQTQDPPPADLSLSVWLNSWLPVESV